jgi:steroid 5-alpha reductase family enzyme
MKRNIIFLLLMTIVMYGIGFLYWGSFEATINAINTENPLIVIIVFSVGMALATFIMGTATGDYSWVDRLWSTAPVAYGWYYMYRAGQAVSSPILSIIGAILVTLWGARLTFNFSRRGGYTGHEDYRWSILRSRITIKPLWHLFSLGFISFYQITLFVLFTLPLYALYHGDLHGGVLSVGVGIGVTLALILLVFETIADQQQWTFHKVKQLVRNWTKDHQYTENNHSELIQYLLKHGIESTNPYIQCALQGFCRTGLFRFSRHPNYFGELGFWWSLWIVGIAGAGMGYLWTLVGPVMLTLLFIGSTVFTEGITKPKYQQYGTYQKETSPIIPWFPKKG